MQRLKYLISESGSFVIFSDTETHSYMAKGLHRNPVGAGFCTIAVGYKQENGSNKLDDNGNEERNINVHCFGESLSLGIKSRDEDEEIINSQLNY